MTADEVRSLSNEDCILIVRDEKPVMDRKFNTFKHPKYGELSGVYKHRVLRGGVCDLESYIENVDLSALELMDDDE